MLPAAASRLARDGVIYAEARSTVAASDGLGVARSDRAGQVQYHLLRKIEATEQGAGVGLGGESDPTYASMAARGTSTSVKLTNKDGQQQLIVP